MKNLIIKRCSKCGATVKILKDCTCNDCGLTCCGEKMLTLTPNTFDAAKEKHVPTYEVMDNKIIVNVNHVMEPDHYIEWITIVYKDKEITTYLEPGSEATATYPYEKGAILYAYCNKHLLWQKEVE